MIFGNTGYNYIGINTIIYSKIVVRSIKKKDPTINDFNQPLKDNGVIEIADWRFIQHLADLRNLCDHNKKIEPKHEQIDELIDGVDKITKTIF